MTWYEHPHDGERGIECDILIHAGLVLTPYSLISDGAVAVRGDQIIEVGSSKHLNKRYDPRREVGDSTHLLIPGLVNAHSHCAMTLFRGSIEDVPLREWLHKKVWPAEEQLTTHDVYVGAKLGIAEMLLNGITAFQDQYFFMRGISRAVDELGARAVLAAGVRRETFNEVADFVHSCRSKRITPAIAAHSEYKTTLEELKRVKEFALENDIRVTMHLAENKSLYHEACKRFGGSVVKSMDKINFLGSHLTVTHGINLDEEEIKLLAARRVSLAHCPLSNFKIGQGLAPIMMMKRFGLNIALGTDGPASNNSLDLIRDAKTMAVTYKAATRDPTILPVNQIIRMLTINGARALGLEHQIGTIAPGKKADMVLVNMHDASLAPFIVENALSLLIYSGSGANVDTVIVDGNIVVLEKRLLTADLRRVIERATATAEKLFR
ncbi:MAG: amidohydrolase family protein [Candidatus Ranarchaeia archaeon]